MSSSDISSDDDDFEKYKSPGGKQGFKEPANQTERAPYTPKSRDHYDVTTCDLESVSELVEKVVTPLEPCQLINAEAYKNLVLEMTPGIEPFRNTPKYVEELTVFVLKATKVFCKSDKAKEVLAGFKLLELLCAQLGKPFFEQLCCTRWAERIYDIWDDTREPIHKLTIAQLVADWIYTFDNRVTVLPFRIIGQKMPLPPATQDARNRREQWENRVSGNSSAAATPKSNRSTPASTPKSKPVTKVKIVSSPKSMRKAKEEKAQQEQEAVQEKPAPAKPKGGGSLSEKLQGFFTRYDLDGSGTINSADEMQQLCTNAIFKLKMLLPPPEVEKRIASAGDVASEKWDFGQFESWFMETFEKELKQAKLI